MRIIPRSLVAQITLLVMALGILSFGLHIGLLGLWLGSASDDIRHAVAGQVRLTREVLRRIDKGERSAVLAGLNAGDFKVQSGAPTQYMPEGEMPLLARHLLAQIRQNVGPEFRVSLALGDPHQEPQFVLFDFEVDQQPWQIQYTMRPPVRVFLGTGVGWLLLLACAVFSTLALGIKLIGRPMSQLATMLRDQGDSLQALPMPDRASHEVQTLVKAFNHLVDEVDKAQSIRQQMLAGVPHDLRTPLARVRLRVETQVADPVATSLIADIDAIERIVSQFIAYAQGENAAGLGEPGSAQQIAKQTVSNYANQGHAVFMASFDGDFLLPDIALQRVLSNLIDNALTYGGTPIEVRVSERRSSDAVYGVISVQDHGQGMTSEEFDRAKQPFVRLGPDKSDLGRCGLGLAIVNQIALQLKATLESDWNPRTGIFTISLAVPMGTAHRTDG